MPFSNWINRLFGVKQPTTVKKMKRQSHRPSTRLQLFELETRLAPAITILDAGIGTLDGSLSATDGTITSAESGGAQTLSRNALLSVGPTINISISSDAITLNNLSSTLTLKTGPGNSATFNTGAGAFTFNDTGDTLATSGGSLSLIAGAGLTIGSLNAGGGNVVLTAGTTVTQAGSVVGAGINVTGPNGVTVESVIGTSVTINAVNGSITSNGAALIQTSAQLTLNAKTGIDVNSLANQLAASNSTSGDILIEQSAASSQTLTLVGDVTNSSPTAGDTITIVNYGEAIVINTGVNVLTTNNNDVELSAQDLTINGIVNSGTGVTTLSTSTAGRQIDLGTNTVGKLSLTQAELNSVLSTGVLRIGAATSGTFEITAAISANAPIVRQALTLISGDAMTDTAAGSITSTNLRLSGAGPIVLDNGTPNTVDNLVADLTGPVLFSNGTSPLLNVGAGIDGVTGITTTNDDVILEADNLNIANTIDAGAGSGGTVTFRPFTPGLAIDVGSAVDTNGPLELSDAELDRVSAGVLRIGSYVAPIPGAISVTAPITLGATIFDSMFTLSLVSGDTITDTATGSLSVLSLNAVATNGVTLDNATNSVFSISGSVTTAGGDWILVNSVGLQLFTIDGVSGITVDTSANSVIRLTANAAVTQVNGADVTGNALELLGTGPYTLNNLTNDVTVVSANLTAATTGTLSYTDADTLNVGAAGGTNGVTTNNSAITLTTVNGDINVFNDNGGTDVNAGTAAVALTVGTTGADSILNLVAGSSIAGGSATLTANRMRLQNGSINVGAGSAILQQFANGRPIDLGSLSNSTPGVLEIRDAELDVITAGVIVVGNSNSGNISVTNAISPANTNQLELVTGGEIIDFHAGNDITVARLGLTAVTGIGVTFGESFRLDIRVDNVEATTNTGGINLANTITVVSIGGVNSTLTGLTVNTSGDIFLSNEDTILLTDTDGLQTIKGGSTSGNVELQIISGPRDITSTVDRDAIIAPGGSVTLIALRDINLGNGSNFDNDVRARTSVTFTASRDIIVQGFTDIASDDFGGNTGGSVFFSAGRDITISNANGDDASVLANGNGSGNVTLNTSQNTVDGALTISSTLNPVTSVSGNVIINTDRIVIGSSSEISATTTGKNVTIQQVSSARPINLGTAGDPNGVLNLTDTELKNIFTPTLRIGDVANTGAITVTSAIAPTNVTNLALRTAGAIVDGNAVAGADITVANLALRASTGIGSADVLETAVSKLAFANGTSGNVNIVNSGALTIDSVDGITSSSNAGVGTTSVTATSPLTFAVSVTSGGTATYTAGEISDNPTFADDLTVNAGVTVGVTSGDLFLRAGDDVILKPGSVVSSSGALTIIAGFNDLDGGGTLTLDGTLIGNPINLFAQEDILVKTLNQPGVTVNMTSVAGAILDFNDPPTGTLNITANILNLTANKGIGIASVTHGISAVDAPLEVSVNTLSVTNTGAGVAGDVNVVDIAGGVSVSGSNAAAAGKIILTAQGAGSLMTVNLGNLASTNGDITLSADDMAINGTVAAGTGIVTLKQVTNTRAINLGNDAGGSLGLTDAELDRVSSTTRLVIGDANSGNVTVSAPIDAGGVTTLHVQTGGSIVKTGGGLITETNLALQAVSGIGTSVTPIDTAVSFLEAVTATGGIFVNNTGLLNIGGVLASIDGVQATTSGNITIINNATIVLNGNSSEDIRTASGDVLVNAVGASSDVEVHNDSADAIDSDSGNVTVQAGRDILLGSAADDDFGDVEANGNVVLTAGRDIVLDENTDVEITGTGTFTGTAGRDFRILASDNTTGSSIQTDGGSITITTGAGGILVVNSEDSNTINSTRTSAADGNITINADRLDITASDNVRAGTAIVTILQVSAAWPINLGTAGDPAGSLNIEDAEFDRIVAGRIRVGDAANTGNVTITSQINPANTTILAIRTAGGISDGTAGEQTDITIADLVLIAGAGVGSSGDGDIDVNVGSSSIAALNTTIGDIFISDADSMAVGSVDGTDGVSNLAVNGNVVLVAGTDGSGFLLVKDTLAAIDVQATGTGAITLRANDAVTLDPSAVVQSGNAATGGTITIQSNFVDVNGTADIVVSAGAQILTNGDIILSADPDSNCVGGRILLNSGTQLAAPGGGFAQNITLQTGTVDITLDVLNADEDIIISCCGNILDDGNDTTFITAGDDIFLTSGGRIGGQTALTPADILSASTGTPSANFLAVLDVAYGDDLTLDQVGSLGNVQIRKVGSGLNTSSIFYGPGSLAGTGNQLALISSGGVLTVDNAFATTNSNEDLMLATTGGNNVVINTASSVTNNGATATTIVMASGSTTASISGPAIDTTAEIAGTNITLVTSGGNIGSAANPLEINANGTSGRFDGFTNGAVNNVANTGGDAFVTDTVNGIRVGQFNAGSAGDVTLLSLGNITPAGSAIVSVTPNDGVAEIIGDVVTINVTAASTGNGGQIGFFSGGGQFFEVNGNVLNASTNDSRLWISEVGSGATAGTAIGLVTVNGSNTAFLRVRNGGALTSEGSDAGTADVVAGTVNLSAPEGGQFGTSAASPLEVSSDTLVATVTGTGDIFVRDVTGGLIVQQATTGSGNVYLDAAGAAANMVLGNGSSTSPVVAATGGTATLTATGAITSAAGGGIGDVAATSLAASGATGVGTSGTPLETAVANLAANGGTGGVFITNTGNVVINTVGVLVGVSATAGDIAVTAAGSLLVSANVTGAASVVLSTTDSAATSQNLTVNTGVTVSTTGTVMNLLAGDNLTINGAVTVGAGGTMNLNGDVGDADAGVGTTITVSTTAVLTSPTPVQIAGNVDADTFNVAPQATVGPKIVVSGNLPTTLPGDVLNVNLLGVTGASLDVTGVGAGDFTFTNRADLSYAGIETLNAVNGQFALVVDMVALGFQNGGTDVISLTRPGANLLLTISDNGGAAGTFFNGANAGISTFQFIGSNDTETLNASTSTTFPMNLDAGGNAVGGPTVTTTVINASTRTITLPVGDKLVLNDSAVTTAGTYTLGAGSVQRSGQQPINAANFESAQLTTTTAADTVNVNNLPVLLATINAFGGDTTNIGNTPAGSSLTINSSNAASKINVNSTGAGAIVIFNGGNGADTMTVNNTGVDGGVALNGNGGADRFNIAGSGATTWLELNGDDGDDTFAIGSKSVLKNIKGKIAINGGPGADYLAVNDSKETASQSFKVNATAIFRGAGTAGQISIYYSGISKLNLYGGTGNDSFAVTAVNLATTTSLLGGNGNDKFNVSVLDTSGYKNFTVRGDGGANTLIVTAKSKNATQKRSPVPFSTTGYVTSVFPSGAGRKNSRINYITIQSVKLVPDNT